MKLLSRENVTLESPMYHVTKASRQQTSAKCRTNNGQSLARYDVWQPKRFWRALDDITQKDLVREGLGNSFMIDVL